MRRLLPGLLAIALVLPTCAQTPATPLRAPVLMLSDIHFNPFADPDSSVMNALATHTPDAWDGYLAAEKVSISGKSSDTDYRLFVAALAKAKASVPDPAFITVSGDLITHNFRDQFNGLLGSNSSTNLQDFSAKTVAYVALKLQATFPNSPIYLSLGNNDSPCDDYAEDGGIAKSHNPYFTEIAPTFAAVAHNASNAKAIADTFPILGNYVVTLPAPMQNTRLIVLQDLYQHKRWTDCGSNSVPSFASAQVDWLNQQLDTAPAGTHFWLMAHIPPGFDPVVTIDNPTHPSGPITDPGLAKSIAGHAGSIKLVLLGHTHMDEMRLYAGSVPGRLNPSITPWTGNKPSYTVAFVDPTTATLDDFDVYLSDTPNGDGEWPREYEFSGTYSKPDYSGASLAALVQSFKQGVNSDYVHYYKSKNLSTGQRWKSYVCLMQYTDPGDYKNCFQTTASYAKPTK